MGGAAYIYLNVIIIIIMGEHRGRAPLISSRIYKLRVKKSYNKPVSPSSFNLPTRTFNGLHFQVLYITSLCLPYIC